VLVGDGPAVPKLREYAVQGCVADRVIFAGSIPYDQVPRHIAAMDIVLLPRAVEYASPLKLFEYMAAGKAIVAPHQENLLEILTEGGDALCFPPEDRKALEVVLCRLVEDESLRRRLGEEAKRTIERRGLTWAGNASRIVNVASELLSEHAGTVATKPKAIPAGLVETGAGR
jgi:glycosyltransferase involved in cell wall biosynthesis